MPGDGTERDEPAAAPLDVRQADASRLELRHYAHDAMAAEFELHLAGVTQQYGQQAAWAAFDELDALECEISRFVPTSDVSQINALTTGASVRIGAAALECLQLAEEMRAQTDGAFDVTMGALADCWRGATSRHAAPPEPAELEAAAARTGLNQLAVDLKAHTVTLLGPGVTLDFGGIGKGYALDLLRRVLADWNVSIGFVHGGQSTVLSLGHPEPGNGWSMQLRTSGGPSGSVMLVSGALSGSGAVLHGSHIIDPRSRRPARVGRSSWAAAPSGARADALSTAFMVMSLGEVESFCRTHPETGAIVLDDGRLHWFLGSACGIRRVEGA